LRTLLIVIVLVSAILGYGYWHSATHASFHMQLNFKAADSSTSLKAPETEIRFKDSAGNLLAKGISDKQYGYLHLLHPEVGDCHEVEKTATTSTAGRTAWQECFAHVATWIPQWANEVTHVDLLSSSCQQRDIPVTISRSNSEWSLWWVPLPHVGGKPYSYYSLTLTIDEAECNN